MPLDFQKEIQNPPAHWANYLKAANALNQDRLQTQRLDDRGFYEMNPILGRKPSGGKINTYFASYMLAPYILNKVGAPDWLKSSLADSLAMGEEMLVEQNSRLFKTGKHQGGLPIAAKFTYNGDWDRPLERAVRMFLGRE